MFSYTQPNPLEALIHRPRPSAWDIFWRSPVVYLAQLLYKRRTTIPVHSGNAVSVVCVSDTHNSQPTLPAGDILVHAGDLTQSGSLKELQTALDWIQQQPHPHKIIVAGNHDLLLDTACDDRVGGSKASAERSRLSWGDIIYLQDSSTQIICKNGRKLNIYGSPKSCRNGNWAFQYSRANMHDVWAGRVPENTDILITHGPPRAHLDLLNLGCPGLLEELWRVRPALHVFGHVHEGYGSEYLKFDDLQRTFERTVVARGGVCNLLWTAWAAFRSMWSGQSIAHTVLVNPAVVGGLRDDEKRRPVKVAI